MQVKDPGNPKGEDYSRVADVQNKAGNVSRPQDVPKGGSADVNNYTTWEGNKANGKRASDGKRAPDGGHGFSPNEQMSRSGYQSAAADKGFESREMPDRSNVLTANAQASDMTRSKPKLLDRGTRAPASGFGAG
jgi:hypothetical protein